jgi:hypothetical protein
MLKLTKIALAAALLVSSASIATAQGLDLDLGVDSGDSGISTGLDIDSGVTIDLMTGDEVETDVRGGTTATIVAEGEGPMALEGISTEDQVKLILRSRIKDDGSFAARLFADADARNTAYHDQVQSEIESNATLVAALEGHGFGSDDVVALRSTAEGNVVLFVDDQA